MHRIPPEEIGDRESIAEPPPAGMPEFFFLAADQMIRLPPEPDFGQVPEVPAVAHDAVIAGRSSREERGLSGARDTGQHTPEFGLEALSPDRGDPRRVPEKAGGETDDVHDQEGLHAETINPLVAVPDQNV